MTVSELKKAIAGLSDGGSAQIIAKMVIEVEDFEEGAELDLAFIRKTLEKVIEGHHQSKEFAIAAMKVLNGQ